MTTANFGSWSYELVRDRHAEFMQEAAQQRLLNTAKPAHKPWLRWLQPLALLRTWRLVTPRLELSSPVDEAPCN